MNHRGTSAPVRVYASGLVPRSPREAPPARWEVQVCRLWLRLFARPCSRINTKVSSRGIQVLVDEWSSLFTRRSVSNGAVIQAAIDEGYAIRPARFANPDAHFDCTLRLWTRFESRARTFDGA